MMRKNLWDLALADFHNALDHSRAPLTLAERSIARRGFSSKYGCADLLASQRVVAGLAGLARRSPAGRALAQSMARGFLWRIRESFLAREGRRGVASAMTAASLAIASTRTGSYFLADAGGQGRDASAAV
jgi:hypothetical protein